jgi:hypothetical protein
LPVNTVDPHAGNQNDDESREHCANVHREVLSRG